MKKYMTTCDEATEISDRDQYHEASSWELIKLGFHTMMCKSCKVYTVQNKMVTKALDHIAEIDQQEIKTLSIEEKEALKKQLK